MAKQQSTKELVDQLEVAVKTSKELLKYYNDLSALITESAKQLKEGFGALDKKTTKGLSDFNKLLAQTNKLTTEQEKNNQEKEKTERELIKNQQELSKLRKIQIQEQQAEIRLQRQIRTEQEKAAKKAEKEAKDLKKRQEQQAKEEQKRAKQLKDENNAYKVKSKRLNDFRNKYKELAAQERANSKTAKTLLKGIKDLDKELKEIDATVGQNQRSVGDYKKALEGLNSSLGKLGVVAVVVKGFELLSDAFGSTREGAMSMRLVMNRVSATVQVTAERFRTLGTELINIFSREGGYMQSLENFGDAMAAIFSADRWAGYGESINNLTEEMNKQTKAANDYDAQILKLERSIGNLNKLQRIQLQIAENDTLSFQTRKKASEEAVRLAIELGNVQEEQAEKELKKQTEIIALQLQSADVLKTTTGVRLDATKVTADQVIRILERQGNAIKVSQENEEAFTSAYVGYKNAQLEATEVLTDTLEKQNKLYSDEAEARLDILIDANDNQKSINERIINNEKRTYEERQKLVEQNRKLFDESWKAQQKVLIDFNNQVIDSEQERIRNSKELSTEQKRQMIQELELQRKKIDEDKLAAIVNEENAVKQADMILSMDLNEKTIIRLLQAIRDYRTGVEDLNETEEGYNDTLAERDQLQTDILNKTLRNSGELADFEKKQREDRIKAIKEEMKTLSENTGAYLKLQSELLDLEFDKQQEALAKRKELIEASIQVIEQAFDRANEKRKRQIEQELTATTQRINEIQRKAEIGNQAAQESLAAEERKQAELERKKEQQRKREQRQEMLIAGLNLLSENADNPNALGKSISDVAALVSIVSSLPTFLKGTEDTGNGGNLDNNGGFLSVLHPNERVLTKEQNKALGGLTNDEVAELGRLHNMGAMEYSPVVAKSNKALEEKVDQMTKAINTLHQRIPVQKVDYNAKAKEYEHRIQSNNKTEVLRQKAKNIWR